MKILEFVLFSVVLIVSGDKVIIEGGIKIDVVKVDVVVICKDKEWVSLIYMIVIVLFIRRFVYFLYFEVNFRYRLLMMNFLEFGRYVW